MRAVFRVDASLEIGIGHVMRCLTLANALREAGTECSFICREHPGNLLDVIREQRFEATALPAPSEQAANTGTELPDLAHARWLGCDWRIDAEETHWAVGGGTVDWVIVDHYALDARWEQAVRRTCKRLMVIDDLADRVHHADLLLDQNLISGMQTRYKDKVSGRCECLLGPTYALLQSEYAALHMHVVPRKTPITRIFAYFGGADSFNVTGRTISAFLALKRRDISLDVVINPSSPHADQLCASVEGCSNITLHHHLPSLTSLMTRAQLAIGAGGATSWERCCLGLPSLVATIAEHQIPIAAELDRRGIVRWLGHHDTVSESVLVAALDETLSDVSISDWSRHCLKVVDGDGASRVTQALTRLTAAAGT